MRARAALLIGLLVAGCSADSVSDPGYHLREGAIDGPSRLTTGDAATLQVANSGDYSHTLVVTDEHGAVIGATGLVASGEQTALELNLAPGAYVFSCRIVAQDDEGNLIDHYEQGMHRSVTVTS